MTRRRTGPLTNTALTVAMHLPQRKRRPAARRPVPAGTLWAARLRFVGDLVRGAAELLVMVVFVFSPRYKPRVRLTPTRARGMVRRMDRTRATNLARRTSGRRIL